MRAVPSSNIRETSAEMRAYRCGGSWGFIRTQGRWRTPNRVIGIQSFLSNWYPGPHAPSAGRPTGPPDFLFASSWILSYRSSAPVVPLFAFWFLPEEQGGGLWSNPTERLILDDGRYIRSSPHRDQRSQLDNLRHPDVLHASHEQENALSEY